MKTLVFSFVANSYVIFWIMFFSKKKKENNKRKEWNKRREKCFDIISDAKVFHFLEY